MQISVLIEPIANNGYRATSGPPLAGVAEAATREEALAELKKVLQARLAGGAELILLELGPKQHPLAEFAGMFKDDPYFDDVVNIMAANRRKTDLKARVS